MRIDMDGHRSMPIGIGLAIAIALGGCASTVKAPAISHGLSGYEIFPGNTSGSVTAGGNRQLYRQAGN